MSLLAARTGERAAADVMLPVLREAAEWFALLHSPEVADEDIERWRHWLADDERHGQAWARVEAISGKFEHLPASNKPAARQVLDAAAERQAMRRRTIRMLSLLCGVGMGAWGLARFSPWPSWTSAQRTGTGERREIQLADSTSVWLNTCTEIKVDFSSEWRRVSLVAGEILVQTAPDFAAPPRPFVVDTGQGRLRALGTRFSVQQLGDASLVAVFEGAVEVRPRRSVHAPARILRTDEQVRFTTDGIESVMPAETLRSAWTKGLLVAENMRLKDFLGELSRYRRGHLGCDPQVADMRIVGTYSLADTDRILATLEATLPVRVRSSLPWWTVVGPR